MAKAPASTEVVVTCLGEGLRDSLANRLEELDDAVKGIAIQLLDELPSCPAGSPLGIEIRKAKKRKRQPTEYQLFVQRYINEHKAEQSGIGHMSILMQEAAAAWRQKHPENHG